MDQKTAKALISPLKEGDKIAGNWHLKKIHVSGDRSHIEYTISQAELRMRLSPRDGRPKDGRESDNFRITIRHEHDEPLSKAQHILATKLQDLIEQNDRGNYNSITTPDDKFPFEPEPRDEQSAVKKSRLYLVPGYIGHPHDLSLRTWNFLRNIKHIVIENGKESLARELFDLLQLDYNSKNFILLDEGPTCKPHVVEQIDSVIEAGEDCMFFGLDEGLPGFIDPGYNLLTLAREREDRLEVRTVGGGGALAAATMRVMPRNCYQQFLFLGHLESWGQKSMLDHIAKHDPYDHSTCYVFFSKGRFIKECWEALQESVMNVYGELYLMANLAHAKEYCFQYRISDLSNLPIQDVRDDDKIVVWIHPEGRPPTSKSSRSGWPFGRDS